jgi:hypothetical protein
MSSKNWPKSSSEIVVTMVGRLRSGSLKGSYFNA